MRMDGDASLEGLTIAVQHGVGAIHDDPGYLLSLLRTRWEARGALVCDVTEPDRVEDADLVFVHVDRSVVPSEILGDLRGRRGANLAAADIRKSVYLDHLLRSPIQDSGPVIVKSELNHAGLPERLASGAIHLSLPRRLVRAVRRRLGLNFEIRGKHDYRIYSDASSVPRGRFEDGSVVQRFMPERRDGRYVLREYYFLGDREFLSVEEGDDPILTSGRQVHGGPGSPPAEVRAVRDRLRLDYGKLDYGLVDGEVVVYDANKTVGIRRDPTPGTIAIAEHLAGGIDSFLR